MSRQPIAILATGMVTGVGLSAPASCAAIRAGLNNFDETGFMDSGGEWIPGSTVPLERPLDGTTKLARILAMVIGECLSADPTFMLADIPVLCGLAEEDRPGRLPSLETELAVELRAELGDTIDLNFSPLAYGRVAGIVGLMRARQLIYEEQVPHVIVAGVDSLLVSPTLTEFDTRNRLLTSANSNGFLPGEGAAAILVGRPSTGGGKQTLCLGFGTGKETASIESEIPLRADGLVQSIGGALADAGCAMGELDFRISDVSGEQYGLKEAALAATRLLRDRKEEFDILHPADCIGEVGAAAATASLCVLADANRKGYAKGDHALYHGGNDDGRRVSAIITHSAI